MNTARFHKTRAAGFTLIELMVVITVITILATMVLFGLGKAQAAARDAARQQIMMGIQGALERYYGDYQQYPSDTGFGGMIATSVHDNLCAHLTPWGPPGGSCNSPAYIPNLPVDPNKSCVTGLGSGAGGSWIPCSPQTTPSYQYSGPDGTHCMGTFLQAYQLTLVKESGGTIYFCSPQQ